MLTLVAVVTVKPPYCVGWSINNEVAGTYRDLESKSGIDYSTFIKFRRQLKINHWLEHKGPSPIKTHEIIDFKTRPPLAAATTSGARADIVLAKQLVKMLPDNWQVTTFLGDKGYDGLELVEMVRGKRPGVKVCIPVRRTCHIACKCPRQETEKNRQAKRANRTLTRKLYNQRTEIERCFSRKKGVFHLGQERTRGLSDLTANVTLTNLMAQLKYLAKPEERGFSPSSYYK